MAKKPCHIPECQFRELIRYWNSEKFKKMSETNEKNPKKLMNPHTAGKKSFALVHNKLKDKGTISSKYLFVVTRTRKPGRLYKASNEDTTSKIAEIEEIEKQISINGEYVDAFSSVMGPEHPGLLRLYGTGQMQERMQKMEKQMEEQKKIVRQEVIADVIAQPKHAGIINPNILAALSTPSPREQVYIRHKLPGWSFFGK
uniref:Uncharacterized protein n=1 Tax=Solanum lycopersicum TaxID=4081 RepID=A0A3Q7H9P0_SOLLC